MDNNKNITKTQINDLTDKDFYEQACQYFYYHAEQRTTMINYFIAVFGAGIALYGNTIGENPVAGALISGFLLLISVLFCSIDLRNRFDVKHSQSVISQIEHDCGKDLLKDKNAEYVYGVFSNEDNTFRYYGLEHRREECNAEYRELRKIYRKIKFLKFIRAKKQQISSLEKELDNRIESYLKDDETISFKEFKSSMGNKSIRSLSQSIKLMYYLCMVVSVGGMFWAVWETGILDAIVSMFNNI